MQDIKRKDGFYLTYVAIKFIVRNTFALCVFFMTAMWEILKTLGPFIEAFNENSTQAPERNENEFWTDFYYGDGTYRNEGPKV